jgi:murein L,D-transpeptidase YafK
MTDFKSTCLLLGCLLLGCLLTSSASAEADSRHYETLLAQSLLSLRDNHLDDALHNIEQLTRDNPNFRLAQLIKGDLLMARAGAIEHFGAAAHAKDSDIDDLREEAKVRLDRVQAQIDPARIPGALWQMSETQKYVLVVDTSRSSLLVYQNINGEPRYVTDFYVTIGKLGVNKVAEGDQRTPIGVYFITDNLPKTQLADFYGSGAYPLSYPNEWDQRNNRTGKGIWLHGTPSDTYSRPPRASSGCVVLTNTDLNNLSPYLQIGATPVIITGKVEWRTEADQTARNELLNAIEQWRSDWSNRNMPAYLKHYAPSFASDGMDYSAWAKQKQRVNEGKTWIKLNIRNLSLLAYPDQPDMVVADFEQDYNSNNLSNKMKKRQYWVRRNNTWQIIYEGAA